MYVKTINLLCIVNKVFVKYQGEGGINPLPAYALGTPRRVARNFDMGGKQ